MPTTFAELLAGAKANVQHIDVATLEERRRAEPSLVILDVREQGELESGVIPQALCITRGFLEARIEKHVPDRNRPIAVMCASGTRATLAAQSLMAMGYAHVFCVQGGMAAWKEAGLAFNTPTLETHACSSEKLTWDSIRADFPITGRRVPVLGGLDLELAYLDHAASTHAPRRVIKRFSDFMCREYANIHRGTHLLSRQATQTFDDCYETCSQFIGGNLTTNAVVFTMNTTQAIDIAAHVVDALPGKVLLSSMEHHSNDLPYRKRGDVLRARCLADGTLDMQHMEELLKNNRVKLVAITGASNLTGWLPPIYDIARMAHAHGALILVDGAQILAHYPMDVRADNAPEHIDFFVAAGHKAYAPFGAAFLYGPRALMDAVPPYLPGGGTAGEVDVDSVSFVKSPDRHQGGTPNIGGVIAMAEAIRFLNQIGMEEIRAHELVLLRKAMAGLRAIDGVRVYGPQDPNARLGVVTFNVRGVSDMLCAAILSEEYGIACRNGRFCSHIYANILFGSDDFATVDPGQHAGAVRASFGLYNTEACVDRLLHAVEAISKQQWQGEYKTRSGNLNTDFIGRCNDKWMESA